MKPILSILILTSFCRFCVAVQNEGTGSKPLVAISGADSKVRKPTYERITTSEKWVEAWVRHLGTSKDDYYRPLMEVDFDRCIVIAIFRGDQINIRQVAIQPLINKGDSIVLRFDELGYQTAGADNNKPPDKPYAFVVLPKTGKTIILEENVQQYTGRPPQWKEVTRLKK